MKSVKTSEMRKVSGGCIKSYYKCKLCGNKKLTFGGANLHVIIKHNYGFPWSVFKIEEVNIGK